MRILILSATDMEIAPCVARLGSSSARHRVIVSGVGMVAAAAHCSRALAESHCDLALNFGLCGSFDPALPPGTVVHVTSDRIAELGAEDGSRFLPIAELGLPGEGEAAEFVNADPPDNAFLNGLPRVRGITVNTVHGSERSIAEVARRFRPQVESMEGAGFMYACILHGVAFAQVRAVSNVVEPRNREAWRIQEAVESLNRAALGILDCLP